MSQLLKNPGPWSHAAWVNPAPHPSASCAHPGALLACSVPQCARL